MPTLNQYGNTDDLDWAYKIQHSTFTNQHFPFASFAFLFASPRLPRSIAGVKLCDTFQKQLSPLRLQNAFLT
jgi:hypothetical protein